MRRFPTPWTVEQIPGGYKVLDAAGQSLAYVRPCDRRRRRRLQSAHYDNEKADALKALASMIASIVDPALKTNIRAVTSGANP